MEFDLETLGAQDRYTLMASLIVPRPIALVTTLDDGLKDPARSVLRDPERIRVSLADQVPVGRFGASFHVRTRDRFAIDAKDASPSNPIDAL